MSNRVISALIGHSDLTVVAATLLTVALIAPLLLFAPDETASTEPDGEPLDYGVQGAEKTYATFELTVTNPGGHSSAPRADNAIYELADALKKIEAYKK